MTFVWSEKRGVALTVALYVLGLVVWSLNAARSEIGLGVAADLQYLVAGLVPALVLALALAVLVAWLKVPAWSRDRLHSWRPRLADAIWRTGVLVGSAGIVGYLLLGISGVLGRFVLLEGLLLAAFVIGLVLVGLTREEANWLFRVIWYVYAPFGIVVLTAAAFLFYADALYPRLPQSLGGGKPRCAQLDLERASLSAQTLADLAPRRQGPIVRTARLDIVFAQGDTLFVRRPGDDRVLELRGGAVRAVVGC